MCFVLIWEQTATCATYSINWLVFITDMKSVYSEVRSESLDTAVCASSLKGLILLHLTCICLVYTLIPFSKRTFWFFSNNFSLVVCWEATWHFLLRCCICWCLHLMYISGPSNYSSQPDATCIDIWKCSLQSRKIRNFVKRQGILILKDFCQ
jgi:hypothetical protein